eukprot:124799-Chlamydomonas_euryale.AAC.1
MAERAQKCGTYRPLDPGTLYKRSHWCISANAVAAKRECGAHTDAATAGSCDGSMPLTTWTCP